MSDNYIFINVSYSFHWREITVKLDLSKTWREEIVITVRERRRVQCHGRSDEDRRP